MKNKTPDPSARCCHDRLNHPAMRTLRVLLRPVGWLYGLIICIRNRLYDWHMLRAVRLNVPVICVGNITAGGSGKTPVVIALCEALIRQGRRPGILTRGYKGTGDDSDEVRLFHTALPEVPVIVDADRVRGGRRALVNHDIDVLVMDDGFQHRRLVRDCDVVLIDATNPWGYGHLLPSGLLREPISALKRASAILMTRCDQVAPGQLIGILRPALASIRSLRVPVGHWPS